MKVQSDCFGRLHTWLSIRPAVARPKIGTLAIDSGQLLQLRREGSNLCVQRSWRCVSWMSANNNEDGNSYTVHPVECVAVVALEAWRRMEISRTARTDDKM